MKQIVIDYESAMLTMAVIIKSCTESLSLMKELGRSKEEINKHTSLLSRAASGIGHLMTQEDKNLYTKLMLDAGDYLCNATGDTDSDKDIVDIANEIINPQKQ